MAHKKNNASTTDIAQTVDDTETLVLALRKATVFICLLYIALRPLGVGLEVAEPEAGVLLCLSTVGMIFYLLSAICSGKLPLPAWRVGLPVAAFFLFASLAVFGGYVSYYRNAADLGLVWLSDLFIFIAVAGSCGWKGVCRVYLCALLAGLAVAGMYALYQYLYAGDYLKHIFEVANSRREISEEMLRGFNIRLSSSRVGGPYAYANALAGGCLLLIPFAWRWVCKDRVSLLRGLVLLPLIFGMVLSGSKAGMAAAKLAEWVGLLLLVGVPEKRLWKVMSAGSMLGLSTLICGGLAAGVYLIAGQKVAVLSFAVLWWLEMLVLPGLFHRISCLQTKIMGAAFIAGMVCAFCVAGYVYQAGSGSSGSVLKLRAFIVKNLKVRYNYWKAAGKMIAEHPLRGVGLDNFGEYYPQYKTVQGWEVKRAHNHYLQLAADGGIPLLLAFLLVWIGIFWPVTKKDNNEGLEGTQPENSVCLGHHYPVIPTEFIYKSGMLTGIAAFVLTYIYFLGNTFTGLGIEYFFSELGGGAGSLRAQGSSMGLLIHGGVNLLILPLVWLAVFHFCLRGYPENVGKMRCFLFLGMVALLFHAAYDFILYHSVVSGVLWVMAGCLIGGAGRGINLKGEKAKLTAAAIVVIAGGVFMFAQAYPWLGGVSDKCLSDKIQYSPEQMKKPQDVEKLFMAALESRPDDAALHALYANILWKYGAKRQALEHMGVAVSLQPRSASMHMNMGQMLQQLNPADARVVAQFSQAVTLYPLKPKYRLELAESLLRQSQAKQAAQMAKEALDIHHATTDERAMLSPEQLKQAQAIAAMKDE